MELIPVLDLMGGLAVHAKGGDRAGYRAVDSVLAPGSSGDSLALIQAYRDTLGVRECYVADLDAIQGGEVQRELLHRLSRTGLRLLVDAGVREPAAALDLLSAGAGRVIVALETLKSFGRLGEIIAAAGPHRVIFSLDLAHGRPVALPGGAGDAEDALSVAGHAAAAGVEALVVLDLARIGAGVGIDVALVRALRERLPGRRILAGGGVGGPGELVHLRDAGCDGVLVATALHTGRLGPADFGPIGQSSASVSR